MQLSGHIRARDYRLRWVALAIITLCAANAVSAQQPNIVIINIDDMGWGDFGVYGSDHSQTPNINALANQGTRFTQFYSGAPICSPSRASLLTGQYAARSNINTFINDYGVEPGFRQCQSLVARRAVDGAHVS